jgi:hypothetical protein
MCAANVAAQIPSADAYQAASAVNIPRYPPNTVSQAYAHFRKALVGQIDLVNLALSLLQT